MSRVSQPVLALLPARARSVGPSAGLPEGPDGGVVFPCRIRGTHA